MTNTLNSGQFQSMDSTDETDKAPESAEDFYARLISHAAAADISGDIDIEAIIRENRKPNNGPEL